MSLKRITGMTAAAVLLVGGLAACGGDKEGGEGGDAAGKVYYLNFKPEQDEAWKKVAAAYTEETGTEVKIVTAASGTYEQTLKTEIEKDDAPTLFNINGPVGYESWKNYTADLSDSAIFSHLADPDMAVKDAEGVGVYGLPFVVEGYGLIYNDAILQKYFATDGAVVKSMDEVNNFEQLKKLAEDMQSKAEELGIKGVFASTSFSPGEDWRWQTHLANYPVFYEYRDKEVFDLTELDLTYSENYKNILDLYVNNSTVPPKATSAKNVTDSMAEFALGDAAFVQNGNWGWGQISEVDGNAVLEDDVKFLPIYIGVEGEEKAGLAIGTENFMSVNSQASEADQKASLDFLEWLFTSEAGMKMVVEDLGFIAPFDTFGEDLAPADPLGKQIAENMNNEDLYVVNWDFVTFPSQDFKDGLGQHLAQYVAGNEDWSAVETYFKDEWKAQKAN